LILSIGLDGIGWDGMGWDRTEMYKTKGKEKRCV
jgi:hypothetical protein